MIKKLIFFILLSLCVALQASAWNPMITTSGKSESGATAICTSFTPGDPYDVLCEDIENSSNFWGGESWTDNIDAPNTFAAADHTDTFNCSEKGLKAAQVFIDFENGDGAGKTTVISATELYVQGYINITVNSIDTSTWATVFNIYETGEFGGGGLTRLDIYHDGSNLVFQHYIRTDGPGSEYNYSSALSLNTWYYIELYWKASTQNGSWFAFTPAGGSRTQYTANEDETTENNTATVFGLGVLHDGGTDATDELTYLIDMVAVDKTTGFTKCSGF